MANPENIDDYEFSNAKELLKISRDMKTDDLWKLYGKETEAGKLLYKIYGKGASTVKIDYPKPKPRPKSQAEPEKEKRIPVSKTIIDYPSVRKVPNLPKIHAVDLIPKRKPEVEIRKEIDSYYSKPMMVVKPGGNRKEAIKDLQDKFKKGRGGLPKGAELPSVNDNEIDYDEPTDEELRIMALKKIPQKNLTYTQKPSSNKENEEENKKKPMTRDQEDDELENLYQQVEKEIEDRQNYLEEIQHLDEPKIKERIKKEIVERVSELEKIIKLMHK